jgi:hypothetical protein
MRTTDIVLTLLESGVAIEWDGDGWRALIGNTWIRLEGNDPAVDVPVNTTIPTLVAA